MRYRIGNELDIGPGQGFVWQNVTYPPDWTLKASGQDMAAIGMEAYEPPVDPGVVEEEVLLQRATLLQGSDWTQLADIQESVRLAWQPYRQALRDVPAQPGFPLNVIWPTPPV